MHGIGVISARTWHERACVTPLGNPREVSYVIGGKQPARRTSSPSEKVDKKAAVLSRTADLAQSFDGEGAPMLLAASNP